MWLRDTITDAHGAPWAVDAWVVVRRGRPVVGEIRVSPAEPASREPGKPWSGEAASVPPRGLERRLLVKVPVGAYATGMVARASRTSNTTERELSIWFLNYMLPGSGALARRPRPRRAVGRDDLFYAELADAYVQRLDEKSMSPVKDIADARNETPAHVRDLLHEARVRDLLSKGSPGKRAGYLRPRALALLGVRPKPRSKGGPR